MDIDIGDAILGQLMDRSIRLEIRSVGFGDVRVRRVDRNFGLTEYRIVVGLQQGDVGRCDRRDLWVLGYAAAHRQELTGAARNLVAAACLGAHPKDDLAEGVVVAIGVVDHDRRAVRPTDDRGQELGVAKAAGWVRVAVPADDSVQPGDSRCHVGVDVVIDLHAGGILGETDVRQRHDRGR